MKSSYWLLLLLRLTLVGRAQTLDPTFQPTTLLNQSPARVLALAAQPDGKSLIAGEFQAAGGALSNNVLRLNADLTRDLSFRPAQGANGPVQTLTVQADGKVLIGGSFSTYAGTVTGPLARLLPSGELDPTFQPPAALVGAQVATLAVQPDGRILVGGPASAGLPGGLACLLPNGALDPAFSSGTGAGSSGQVLTLAVQPADGKILVGGAFVSFSGRASQSLVRLLSDGTPDVSFAPTSFDASTVLYRVLALPDGNLLVGGYHSSEAVFQRLLPSGVPDPQFRPMFDSGSRVRSIQVDTNGRLLVAGYFTSYNRTPTIFYYSDRLSIVRLLPTGEPDPTFPPASYRTYSDDSFEYYDLLPLASGKILTAGRPAYRGGTTGLVLLAADGTPDPTFDLQLQWRGTVIQAVPQVTGKLLVSGTYTTLNGQAVSGQLQRLNADGSLDQDLTLPSSVVPGAASTRYIQVLPQPDGQVYAALAAAPCSNNGYNTCFTYPYVCRIRADNTLDPRFPVIRFGSSFLYTAGLRVLPYANGDLLLVAVQRPGGTLPALPTTLLRIQASGVVNSTFTAAVAQVVGTAIDTVLVQPSGETIINYRSATGQSQLVRLLATGAVDPSFTVGPSPAQPAGASFTAQLLQPDGKLLVTGSFTSFAGIPTLSGVVRLNPDGSVDPTFQLNASLAPLVPLACLLDGRLLVRANSQTNQARLRRLLADGSPDPSFAAVTVTVAAYPTSSWRVVLQPGDQKPVLYGNFDGVDGQQRIGLARLRAASPLAVRPGGGAASRLSLYPNPAHQGATLVLPTTLEQAGKVQLYDALGREVRRQPVPAHSRELTLSLNGLSPGLYLLRCGATVGQLVVE